METTANFFKGTYVPKLYALLVTCNYPGTSYQLNGCQADGKHLRTFLKMKYGLSDENIVWMTDSLEKSDKCYPNRQNLIEILKNFALRLKSGDMLFMAYSGHGSGKILSEAEKIKHPEETDGQQEYIVLDDGFMDDDTLKHYLIDEMPENVKVRCLFDCCHSGTVLDLKYRLTSNPKSKFVPFAQDVFMFKNIFADKDIKFKLITNDYISPTRCDVIMLSGCEDSETSADANISGVPSGALTYAFLKANGFQIAKQNGKEEFAFTPNSLTCQEQLKTILQWLKKEGYSQRPECSFGCKIEYDKINFLF